jgi:hypothetical protein
VGASQASNSSGFSAAPHHPHGPDRMAGKLTGDLGRGAG